MMCVFDIWMVYHVNVIYIMYDWYMITEHCLFYRSLFEKRPRILLVYDVCVQCLSGISCECFIYYVW